MQNVKEHQFREKESYSAAIEILNRRNHELRLLYETSRFFSTTLDINELYDKLFDVLRNIVDMQDMFVATFNEKDRTIKYIYLRSVLEDKRIDVSIIPQIPLAPEGKGILSEAIRKNDTIIIEDYQKRLKSASTKYHVTSEGSLSDHEYAKEYLIESAMIVPIKLNGKILGFTTLMSKHHNEFNDDNSLWIETLVNQAAIANNNAILFKETQTELKEIKAIEEKLENARDENIFLKGELGTRVRENLRIFSDLLKFQADYVRDPVSLEYFRVMRNRADAMIMIQEKLYQQENLAKVELEGFLYALVTQIYSSYDVHSSRVSFFINARDVTMPVDKAISAALMINELVSNSLLHSFPNKKKGNITVELQHEQSGKYHISVRDNGIGVISQKGKPSSFSMVLVSMFVKNLRGMFDIDRKSGTKVEIRF